MKVIINFLKKLIKYINAFELRQNQTCAITDTKQTVNPNKPRYAEEDNGVATSNFRCYKYKIKLVDGSLQISSIEVFKNNLTEKIK